MLSQLSYWPWIVGAAVALVVTLVNSEPDNQKWIFGSGLVATVAFGMGEAANTGILVGEGFETIAGFLLGLALTSLPVSFAAVFAIGYPRYKKKLRERPPE